MKFQTQWQKNPFTTNLDLKKDRGEIKVDTKGHLTNEQQIQRILQAGEDQLEWRREHYDFANHDDIDDNITYPERDVGFDISDASTMLREAQPEVERLVEALKEAKSKKEKAEIQEKIDNAVQEATDGSKESKKTPEESQ